jgi:hypothetical protein
LNSVNALHSGDLRIEIIDDGGAAPVQLVWMGRGNQRQPGSVLTPFFLHILDEAALRCAPIELHFEKLEHLNSSTLATVIQLLQEAQTRKVRTEIFYDHSLQWQRVNFDVLRVFCDGDLLQLRA